MAKTKGTARIRFTNDPQNYALMSAPHSTLKHASEAMNAFLEDVREARQKHRIPEVMIAVMASYYDKKNTTQRAAATASFGSSELRLPLMARLYGDALQEHQETLNKIAGVNPEETPHATD